MSPVHRHCLLAILLAVGWLTPLQTPLAQAVSTVPMGATVQGQGAGRFVTFRVWAPNAESVAVSGDFNGWKKTDLKPEPSRPGHWTLDSRRARPGDAYRFVIDGLERRDPRARAVS